MSDSASAKSFATLRQAHIADHRALFDRVALDLSSLQAVRAGAEAIAAATFDGGGPLHLLVNNAGVMATPQSRTVDDLDLQMATNHFGPFLLTGRAALQIRP